MIFYTDGSCSNNGYFPNNGGYGIVALDNSEKILYTYNKFCKNTTNNREEMKAILYVMKNYGKEKDTPTVYSDSAYSVNTFNLWMWNWANNNWIKSDKKEPENLDLIKEYYDLFLAGYKIKLYKVKGHQGVKFNEMADLLATGKIKATKEGD